MFEHLSLVDDAKSHVHGIITKEGLFEGKVLTVDEHYSIERASHHFREPQNFHTVMYKHSDVTLRRSGTCLSDELYRNVTRPPPRLKNQRLKRNPKDHGRHSRKKYAKYRDHHANVAEKYLDHNVQKRGIDKKKTTCTLYVQADHMFYNKYNNEELVIEQLMQHVQGVNGIYAVIGKQYHTLLLLVFQSAIRICTM